MGKIERGVNMLRIPFRPANQWGSVCSGFCNPFCNFQGGQHLQDCHTKHARKTEKKLKNLRRKGGQLSPDYPYVVNGKSAIEWIMERYQITTHKESGIKNDPNDWAAEVGKPSYILDLLLSIINVSMQTVELMESLPKVNFE